MVSHPLEVDEIDLLSLPLVPKSERFVVLFITVDYFSKWIEIVPLKKASAKAMSNTIF